MNKWPDGDGIWPHAEIGDGGSGGISPGEGAGIGDGGSTCIEDIPGG